MFELLDPELAAMLADDALTRATLPAPDEPLVHIYAEGRSPEESNELEAELRGIIEDILVTEEVSAQA